MIKYVAIALISVLLSCVSQVLLKTAGNRQWPSRVREYLNAYVIGGYCLLGVCMLLGVYVMTALFTEIVTNNAAAAIMFPFAVAIAQGLGVDPRPFAMTIAFAASASFVTPLGYQTNLMVYGPGGYSLRDFVRIGLPLTLLLVATATLLVPIAWPF